MFTKSIINDYFADRPSKLHQSAGGLLLWSTFQNDKIF